MSGWKPPHRPGDSVSWMEIFLILLLLLLLVNIAVRLFGPYIDTRLVFLCEEFELFCP